MLKRLLKEIACQGQIDIPRLAKRLAISEALLRQMLEKLASMGYLRPLSTNCPSTCNHCVFRQRCTFLWELTPAARRLLETMAEDGVGSET